MASLRIVVSQQNRVFKGCMKVAALSISSKIPVLGLSSVKPELLYRTMGSEWGRVIFFYHWLRRANFKLLHYWFSFCFSTTHPSELLMFTKTCYCTLPVFKWPGCHAIRPHGSPDHWLLCWWDGNCFMPSLSCSLQIPGAGVFVPLTESTDNQLLNSLVKI